MGIGDGRRQAGPGFAGFIDRLGESRSGRTLIWCLDFRGRLPRWQFWLYIAAFTGYLALLNMWAGYLDEETPRLIWVAGAPAIVAMVPLVPLAIRRLHDTGRNGAWLLLSFCAAIGFIIVLVLLAMPGQKGANLYGEWIPRARAHDPRR
ncbi:DUF805 domain-containing protein [Plantactinospora sp. CA-290183]|uniref:DUF805 domain-containing protein n=1 Tax=Plantactinospora sp. CA-290183 TaxID=3240006 RepID=UPI003D8BF55E